MHITIITQGTRGDVQPYIALGRGLMATGHRVTIATARAFEGFVMQHGMGFAPLAGDPQQMLESFEKVTDGGSPLDNIRFIRSVLPQMGADMLHASQGADLVISNFNVAHLAYSVAEKLGVPFINCELVPMLATTSYPNPHILPEPPRWWPAALNRLTYAPVNQLLWHPFRSTINQFRTQILSLPPYPLSGYAALMARRTVPHLEAYSRHIMPPAPDWGERVCVTGFWFMPDVESDGDTWTPPDELERFLAEDDRPVYIGFGSMNFGDAAQRTHIVLAALQATGLRAVSTAGWGGLDAGLHEGRLFVLDHAPHRWLFKHVSAAVHHGGAGTVAEAMRAGIPQFIVSFQGDQPFWGQRVAALGLGPASIPRKQLTVDALSNALRQMVLEGQFNRAAHEFSQRIREEDGIANAVAFVESVAGV